MPGQPHTHLEMGRSKVTLDLIEDATKRRATFHKRQNGVMKKAMELSVMCHCDIALVIFDENGDMMQYASSDFKQTLQRAFRHKAKRGLVGAVAAVGVGRRGSDGRCTIKKNALAHRSLNFQDRAQHLQSSARCTAQQPDTGKSSQAQETRWGGARLTPAAVRAAVVSQAASAAAAEAAQARHVTSRFESMDGSDDPRGRIDLAAPSTCALQLSVGSLSHVLTPEKTQKPAVPAAAARQSAASLTPPSSPSSWVVAAESRCAAARSELSPGVQRSVEVLMRDISLAHQADALAEGARGQELAELLMQRAANHDAVTLNF